MSENAAAMPNSLLWLSNELYWRQDLSIKAAAAPAAPERQDKRDRQPAAAKR